MRQGNSRCIVKSTTWFLGTLIFGSTENERVSPKSLPGTTGEGTVCGAVGNGIGPSTPMRNGCAAAFFGPGMLIVCAKPTPSVGTVIVCTVVGRHYNSESPPRTT